MLRYAVIFLIIALVAAMFGFNVIASSATSIAMILFWVFLAVTIVLFILGMGARRSL